MIGDPCRDQAADEVAGDVTRDVSGERAAGIDGAAFLT